MPSSDHKEPLSPEARDSQRVIVGESLSALRLSSALAFHSFASNQLNDSEWLVGLLSVLRPVVNLSVDQIREKCEKDATIGKRSNNVERSLQTALLLLDRAARGLMLRKNKRLVYRSLELLVCSGYFADFSVGQMRKMPLEDRDSLLLVRLGILASAACCLFDMIECDVVARGSNPLMQTLLDVCTVSEKSRDRIAFSDSSHSYVSRYFRYILRMMGAFSAAELKRFDLAVTLSKGAREFDCVGCRDYNWSFWMPWASGKDLPLLIETFERQAGEARAASEEHRYLQRN